jgi:Fe-S cluster assembly protein SufB
MSAIKDIDVKEGVDQETVDAVREVGGEYKYGWNTEIEMEYAPKGVNTDIVRLISDKVIDKAVGKIIYKSTGTTC